MAQTALNPQDFAALVDKNREGWIALHAHDYEKAAANLTSSPKAMARAQWQLALVHQDLARLSGLVHHELFTTWQERSGLPQDSSATKIAALSASCSPYPVDAWLNGSDDEFVKNLINSDPLDAELPPEQPIGKRLAIHRKAKQNLDPKPLLDVALEPLITERNSEFDRTFYDPCLHRTLAEIWMAQAQKSLEGSDWKAAKAWTDDGLEGLLFAPWLTGDVLSKGLEKHDSAGVLGVDPAEQLPERDDIVFAREQVRTLDKKFDKWRTELTDLANDEGDALLADLGLVDRYRQEWLIARSRQALFDNRPNMAISYLEMARDVSERGVGAANAPALLALLAEAQMRVGHTREALDALQLLSETYPVMTGVREIAGDLAVLQGIDRQGDSKEL
ncbi:MAG: hypothetical protein HN348_16250 [Proteobacteria bacterium]|nr:hypothetical protein [Pseudomonadota bacterium]